MKKATPHRRKPKNEYASWDPFTQAKFLYDIHQQVGTPITRAQAYQIAEMGIYGSPSKTVTDT